MLAPMFKKLYYLILFSQPTCAVDNIIPISLMGKPSFIASGYVDVRGKPGWFYLLGVCFLFYQK